MIMPKPSDIKASILRISLGYKKFGRGVLPAHYGKMLYRIVRIAVARQA
jgi:hypothetical protein